MSDDDDAVMLKGITMAFMVMLSRQPNMAIRITPDEMQNFPYEQYELQAFEDLTEDKAQIFCLVDTNYQRGPKN